MKTLKVSFITLALLATCLGAGLVSNAVVGALSGSQFKAGNIIDDNIFFNGSAMTSSQIQSFLNAKVPSCDTDGSETYSGSQTRAEYGRAHDSPPPYTCLKSYKHDTPSKPGESGLCSALSAKSDQTAAQMISSVSAACHVSQKVILVMLQKEQGLITDEWPWPVQYRTALGYGCPDGGSCDSQYYGLFNQIYNAARQFQRYKADPDNWNYPPHMTSSILYNPRTSCGRKSVSIENQATSGLYNYTPYVPNSAALANLHGSGDSCSSYGNRNFWVYFNEWFGSTQSSYVSLDNPTWMQLSADTYKLNPGTGESVDGLLEAGTQLHFDTKIYVNGEWYLRTANDTDKDYNKGILRSRLTDVPMNYSEADPGGWYATTKDLYKVDPQTGNSIYGIVKSGVTRYFDMQIAVGGTTYLRSRYDTLRQVQTGIPLTSLSPVDVHFIDMATPRWMRVKVTTHRFDAKDRVDVGSSIRAGTELHFDHQLVVGQEVYLANGTPSDYSGIPIGDLSEISPQFEKMATPRYMKLRVDSYKINPITGQASGTVIHAGTTIYFDNKIEIGDSLYVRARDDTQAKRLLTIPVADLEEI